MMNPSERFAALAQGTLPDRVPVVCNLLDQGAAELGMGLREYYSRGRNVATAQLAMREKYGYDAVMGSFYNALEAEMLGCRNIIYSDDGCPNVGHLVLGSPEALDDLVVPDDLTDHPRFAEELECIRILKKEAAGRFPVAATVNGSFTLPAILMGVEAWMRLFLTGDPDVAGRLLKRCSEFCVKRVAALREAGAEMIAYVNSLGTAAFLREQQFRELALPWLKRDLEGTGTEGIVYFNGGGRINPFLEIMLQETALQVYYVNPMDDVAEAKAIIGGRALLVAAINDIGLITWNEAQIEEEVRRMMAAGMPGGGFVLGTLMMPAYIPKANIEAMLRAAYRFGSYGGGGR